MNKEESPYCEICGHCGEIGCCGIESFINNHIKGKTNCKNEDWVINGIISICEYETEIFKENELLEKENQELKEKLKKIEKFMQQTAIAEEENGFFDGAEIRIFAKLQSIIKGDD